MLRVSARVLRADTRIELVLGTLGSALVVVALTRRRSREFFDRRSEALGER